jgi:uncharacterized membrane protein
VANLTDLLLFFLPAHLTHRPGLEGPGTGQMYWYWSVVAFTLAILLVSLVGLSARYYFGKKIIEWIELVMSHIPFLNKIYSATRQINDAFATGSKNSFKTVVLVEFPSAGSQSLGFITSEHNELLEKRSGQKLISVFIPTTPNPTSGFLLLVPEEKIIKLDMSVADAIKYIISLGSVSPVAGEKRE